MLFFPAVVLAGFGKAKKADPFSPVYISFRPSTATAPTGYIADNGLAYDATRGYGWIDPTTNAPKDMTLNMALRTLSADLRLRGLVQMQADTKGMTPGNWEYAVPNGTYRVTIGVGDDSYIDSDHQINAEGFPLISDFVPLSTKKHLIAAAIVQVSDGKLTIDATSGTATKIDFITITSVDTVSDAVAPVASLRLVGTVKSNGAYDGQAQVILSAYDVTSGLTSLQYSVNGGAYTNYTLPFNITTAGNYSLTAKAVDANGNQIVTSATTFTIAPAGFKTVNIAFLPSSGTTPTGYTADNGLAYSATSGYGWIDPTSKAPKDMTLNMALRTLSSDLRMRGVAQMQANTKGLTPGNWEYALPNGTYRVTVGVGDDSYIDSDHQINVEGFPIVSDFVPLSTKKHLIGVAVVQVSDGKLTIDANGGTASKINFITISTADAIADAVAPTVSMRLVGTVKSTGAYDSQVQVVLNANDATSGLTSVQYAVNGGAYVNYTVPVTLTTAGNYSVTAKAVDANNNTIETSATTFTIAPAGFKAVNIAFLPSSGTAPTGYTADNGLAYNATSGYGWIDPTTKTPKDMTLNMALRTLSSDIRLRGVAQLQANTKGLTPGNWEYAVPNGMYRVTVGVGDDSYIDSDHQINVEGFPIVSDFVPLSTKKHLIGVAVVQVTDGKITIDANGGTASKLNFITIAAADPVTDAVAPVVSMRLVGTVKSGGAYDTQAQVVLSAYDATSGLTSLQYSINGAAYVNYTVPFTITTAGNYSLTAKAIDANNNTVVTTATNFTVATAGFKAVYIAFLPSSGTAPTGYTADNGLAYSASSGYGWIDPTTKAPKDMTLSMALRTLSSDLRLRGLAQMQANTKGLTPGNWEYAVPNGTYRVTVGAGDDSYYDSDHQINVEGLPVVSDFVPSSSKKHLTGVAVVQVTDGKLTIDATGGTASKLNFVIIAAADPITDAVAPTAGMRLVGTLTTTGAYDTQAQVFLNANDATSGLNSFQYSINNAAYVNYTAPFIITTPGTYNFSVKAVDANNNQTIITPATFVVAPENLKGSYMYVQNMDGFPANDRLLFSLIQTPWRRTDPDTTPYNANHDKVKLRINNKGVGKLKISGLTLSNPAAWKIVSIGTDTTATLPVRVASESYVDITIQFKAKDAATRLTVLSDTLTLATSDSIAPVKKIKLVGIWQAAGESTNEPYAQQVITAFGFTSVVGYGHDDNGNDGTSRMPSSSEVVQSYFVIADPSKPVTVRQVVAYHGCCSATESFKYFTKGSTKLTTLFTHNPLDGQSVLPRLQGSTTTLAQGTFTPTGSFGIQIGSSCSDRTKNYQGLIGIRFLKAMDGNGNIIPNAYFLDCDYLGTPYTNFDYQDNIYYVENIKPDGGSLHYSDLAATPNTVMDFGSAMTGTTNTVALTLKNMGISYPDSSTDSPISIKSVQIVGPNASEFAMGSLKTNSLAIQATTPLNVKFVPTSTGIKNAVLLVNYNSASSPLRVPFYGIANTATSTVGLVKRIKGGSDVAMTIGGKVYEADINYRQGSIKLDQQVIASPILASDIDSLYQTYLSAAADLAETRYAIPIPNGNYMVRMHFTENYWTAAGQRVFSINMENQPVLTNFDIFNEVGYRSAIVKDFQTTVTDGSLDIKFNPTANRVAICGIEIYQVNGGQPALAVTQQPGLLFDQQPANTGKKITIYPNPNAGSYFSVKIDGFNKNDNVTLTVTNMMGRLQQTQKLQTDASGSATVAISLNNNLAKGIYIINTQSSSGVTDTKFLVQ
ncbi:OmpL47-type beta-barrel domain-containing protein [Mucilaginibacter agri]|uniref:T9SS type A sorting domain-containing protein n=1 Tax=Mucilaginibacter agri TaxID=2695265 RepID=A0A965ZBU5_9SPHI|nr:malectin domain-containing carbohydrate-binding protein [Mucilaginibacter agri]NCD68148.1 T9SS type A sorting domain-containing protein [Mucilaginibacter agri]